MAAQLIVHPASAPLFGGVPIAGDQEIALARVALGSLSRGRSSLEFSGEQRSLSVMLRFLNLVGVKTEWAGSTLMVHGAGLWGARAPTESIDLRGEACVGALALGLLVSRETPSELLVDQVVAELLVPVLSEAHPIEVEALNEGARVRLLAVEKGHRSDGLSVATHGVYPWVKQALLLAGLRGASRTEVEERLASADHLERAMTRARMPIDVQGTIAVLHPPRDEDAVAPQIYQAIGSHALTVPLATAVLLVSGSRLTVREVGLNPTRSELMPIVRLMGAEMGTSPRGDRQGEPFGDLSFQAQPIKGLSLGGESMIRLGDGAVYLLALAARATGESFFTDLVASARGAEPKIWGRAAAFLRSAGVRATTDEGGIRVTGNNGAAFEALRVTTGGDGRLAILATLLGLGARDVSVIDDVDCLAGEFPRWMGTLKALGAKIEVKTV